MLYDKCWTLPHFACNFGHLEVVIWLYYIKNWSNRCNICFAVVCCQNVAIITRADFLIYVIRHGDEALLGSSRWISGVKWKLDASEVGEGSTCLIAWLWSQTPFNMKSAIWVGIIRSRLNELSNVGLFSNVNFQNDWTIIKAGVLCNWGWDDLPYYYRNISAFFPKWILSFASSDNKQDMLHFSRDVWHKLQWYSKQLLVSR